MAPAEGRDRGFTPAAAVESGPGDLARFLVRPVDLSARWIAGVARRLFDGHPGGVQVRRAGAVEVRDPDGAGFVFRLVEVPGSRVDDAAVGRSAAPGPATMSVSMR